MITNYEIKVPSVITPGEAFVVRVIARDVDGEIVPDNSTQVTISATSGDIEWDGNFNEVFNEVGDDVKTLVNGIAEFISKDTKSPVFTVSVSDTSSRTGQSQGEYRFNVIVFDTGTAYKTQIQNFDFIRFTGRSMDTQVVTVPFTVEPLAIDAFFTLGKAV